MIKFEKKTLSYFLILLVLLSYFFGFYIREISNGAGHVDLELHIWLIINDLRQDYFETIRNYHSYSEPTFPFFHTFQSFLNPATTSIFYCLNNTIFNLIIIFIFYKFLKLKKIEFDNNFLIILVPYVILLSPWFRSSSYWGMTENFPFFFLIPSLYFLNLLIINKISFNENLVLTILISLTLYARQQYLFLAVYHLLILLLNNDKKKLIYSIIFYSILSIPGFYILSTWGAFNDLSQTTSASNNLSIQNIFFNIPKISSLLFFYSIPVIFLNFMQFSKIFFQKKCLSIFIIILVLKLIVFHDINYPIKGGGYVVKFNQIFFDNDPKFLILISSAFFAFIISIVSLNNYKYFLILPLIYLNFGFITFLYQEWFDPLYIFIYYIFLSNDHILYLRLNKNSTIKFLFVWEFAILIIALIYYHLVKDIPLFYSF